MQNTNQIPESRRCEPVKLCKKSSSVDVYEVLHSLRYFEIFCDVKLETDDKKVINAHKVVLSAASPYFYAMFTNVANRNHDIVVIRQVDYTALLLLVNFIYSGQIVITVANVKLLLPAANLLQLHEVKETCCEFLWPQLCPSNCISINAMAELHGCAKLIRGSEIYIQQHFSEVVVGDEFLSLSSEQVIKLISSDKLTVTSEKKVFESVIRWVKYKLGSRKSILSQLMEHVRLPLTSKDYILKKVFEEPLIKNCFICKHYINEALNFHIFKSEKLILKKIRYKPRHGDKVILVIGGSEESSINSTEWYDPRTNQWHFGPELENKPGRYSLAVIKDHLLFNVGVRRTLNERVVDVLDLSSESPCWQSSVDMNVKRNSLGVGVINDYIYAVGGLNSIGRMTNKAEVFDYNTQKWHMISRMPKERALFSVGVVNGLLYVVGGYDQSSPVLDTVECYNPRTNKWKPIAKMSVGRTFAGVGALYGELYVVGGWDGLEHLSSVEKYRPSTGVWTTVADLNLPRKDAGVVALDGLLYVVGGMNQTSALDTVECYNPYTNTWAMVTATMNVKRILPGVVAINRPQNFTTYDNL